MTAPTPRSVIVRLAMDPASYIAGASRAAGATTALEREVSRVGPATATSMERAAAGAGRAERSFGTLNKAAGTLGFTLGGLAGVGGVVAAALSVKWAGDYESALTRLVTTAGESQKNIGQVKDSLLQMAGQVGISAEDLAKGMYTVESGGFHAANGGLLVMKAAAQGAKQENADLGKVTDAVTTILHDYHLKASDAALVTSQLVTAVSHGKTNFDELTGSLHSVTPLAAKMGITIADVTGTLAAMTASGESADQATQNMANTLQHLANPTNTMINELAQLGISTDDLQKSLSSRGLAGTLQMVEEAIVQHVDPATQRVLLPALNKSKTAAQDLQIMLGQMPPTLAKMSRGLLDGSVSFSDYRKSVRDTGGQAEVMGTQFLSLFQSSRGFNSVLKAGGPAAQVFTAAMAKAFGTTAALNVSLQTTGENAAATNAAIKDIAGASAQADGSIKGWDEVQGNFNQKLSEAEQSLKSLATEAGMHLLPALGDVFGFVSNDVVPGIEHMGSAVGDAAHWWSQLPAPIKDTSLALAGMAIANKIGLLSALTTRVTMLTTGVGRLSAAFQEEVAMQRWAVAVGNISTGAIGAEAGISRMAVAGGLATRAMSGLGSGASRLMGLFGGPWGVALAAGGVALYGLVHWLQEDHSIVPKVTVDTQALTQAIEANSGAIDDNVRKTAAESLQKAGLFKAAQQWGVSLSTLTDAALGNQVAIQKVTVAAEAYKQKQLEAAHSTAVQKDQTGIAADAYEKAAMQSDSWAKALGVLTNSTDNQIAKSKQINQAVGDTTAAQQKASGSTVDFASAAQKMGADVSHVWSNNTVVLSNATDTQVKALHGLGAVITNLPNHQVVVSASTKAARDAINQLTADYHNYSINLGVSGIGATLARAAGGPIVGPGSGTSDSVPVMASNGEHMLTAAEVRAAGGHGAVFALRSAILGGALHRAAGGPVTFDDLFLTAKVGISPSSLAAAEQAIRSALTFAPGAPGNVNANAALAKQMAARYYGWTGAQWNALYALGQRESGWNNFAQNPTSTAYGIAQFLDSTWATVGLSKTSIPAVQIAGMDKYIANRYGTPLNAWAHETRFGWYKNGTPYVPETGPAFLHKGERVLTDRENVAYTQGLRTREFGGIGAGAVTVQHTDARSYPVAVTAGERPAQIVRAIRTAQYQQEFLNG